MVEYAEDAGLLGAKTALECGCDILMGTRFFDSINQFCKEHKIRYMPFVGRLQDRPTILTGQIEDIVAEAQEYAAKGVYGINLLGYRYVGDANRLNEEVVRNVSIPVCLAGSINSYQRLDEVKAVSPWAFTIGSAFFENRFSGSIPEQINEVYEYMNDN